MSGCVTVSGPPRSSWRRNSGTTLPVLPSTLPNRTVTQRMPALARALRCPAPGSTSRPAACWRPSGWSGSPPCRCEISTMAAHRRPRGIGHDAGAAALVSSPSSGLASTIGTCFSAAAWNTSSGRAAANTASMRGSSRMSAITARRGRPGAARPAPGRSATARTRRCPAGRGRRAAGPRAGGRAPSRWCRPRRSPARAVPATSRAMPARSRRHLRTVQQVLDGHRPQLDRRAAVRPARSGAARGATGTPCRSPPPSARPARRRPGRGSVTTSAAAAGRRAQPSQHPPRLLDGRPGSGSRACAGRSAFRRAPAGPMTRYGARSGRRSARRNRSAPSPAPTSSTDSLGPSGAPGRCLHQPVADAGRHRAAPPASARARSGRSGSAAGTPVEDARAANRPPRPRCRRRRRAGRRSWRSASTAADRRNGSPASSRLTAPPTNHSGCSRPPRGRRSIAPATAAAAASAPSRPQIAIHVRARRAAMRPYSAGHAARDPVRLG